MNRRIRKKRAKQLMQRATQVLAQGVALHVVAERLRGIHPPGTVGRGMTAVMADVTSRHGVRLMHDGAIALARAAALAPRQAGGTGVPS